MTMLRGKYAHTPVERLADLLIEALDAGDLDMVRTCAQRIRELGGRE